MEENLKQLLLKDLCARLPYGVIIQEYNEEYGYVDNALNTIGIGYFSIHEASIEGTWINRIEKVKPYLRPMSSMTEEEKQEFYDICTTLSSDKSHFIMEGCIDSNYMLEKFDWLNAHYFDYRNLIERGLAIDCTNLNVY